MRRLPLLPSQAPQRCARLLLRRFHFGVGRVLVGVLLLLFGQIHAPPMVMGAPKAVASLESAYRQATADFHQAVRSRQATAEDWRLIARRFQAIHRARPESRRGAYALYSTALSFKEAWRVGDDWKDLSLAVSAFRGFATVFSSNALADDALMHLAELLVFGYKDPAGALEAYRRVLKDYSRSDLAASARDQLATLTRALAAGKTLPGRLPAPKRLAQKRTTLNSDRLAETRPRPPLQKGAAKGRVAETAETKRVSRKPEPSRPHDPNPPRKVATDSGHNPGSRAPIDATLSDQNPIRVRSVAFEKPATPGAQANPELPRSDPSRGNRKPGWQLKRIQFWSTLEITRVILTTDPEVVFSTQRLKRGVDRLQRLIFDMPNTLPTSAMASVFQVNDGVLGRIRIGRMEKNGTRVVLDFDQVKMFKVKNFLLPTERKIVIDLHPPGALLAALQPRPAPRKLRPRPGNGRASERKLSLKSSLGLKVRSIMLDPGHGGHDPGAIGYGLQEKKVALAIARRLKVLFNQYNPGLKVGLTRNKDRYIPLQERPRLAKKFGADLFVSIHLNASERERFHGVETYFLNLTRNASSLGVAARENATTRKGIGDLNDILVDLLRDTNIVESSQLAKTLQGSLVRSLKNHTEIRDLGVKQAPFLVLMGAEMPSVLVEAGFLTNRRENRLLKDKNYLNRVAIGIHAGLQKYIHNQNLLTTRHPPRNSVAQRGE